MQTDDSIGSVYIDLDPLLSRQAQRNAVIEGWFPIYDTLRGVSGELEVRVSVQFINDVNPFRDSAAGVQFFSLSTLSPKAYVIQHAFGFVEELVVEDDPSFLNEGWADIFRTARRSNDSRQLLLFRLSSEVRTRIGKKVREMGGNAVLGYHQNFDIEGDSGIVARGYGTAVTIVETAHLAGQAGGQEEGDQVEVDDGKGPSSVPPKALSSNTHRHTRRMQRSAQRYGYKMGWGADTAEEVHLLSLRDFGKVRTTRVTRLHNTSHSLARSRLSLAGSLARSLARPRASASH
jgi:hypothetical protein